MEVSCVENNCYLFLNQLSFWSYTADNKKRKSTEGNYEINIIRETEKR